jgi:dehydrogenase/reductase SDR family protein 12
MGETRLVEEVRTRTERDDAFAYAADFDHQAAWDPNTVTSRRLSDPPLAVGSRFALVVRMGRGTLPMEYRITVLEPPGRVVLVGEGKGIWTEDTIELREDGDWTVVRYAATIRLGGSLGLIQPLLGRAFQAIGRGAAAGLQRELDALQARDG